MIKIAVVSYDGAIPVEPISALFGSESRSIGRNEDSFLVLPDPKHYVSRAQAIAWSRGDRHCLTNLSQANPILVNGIEIAAEQECDIFSGDQIQIGLYQLNVEVMEDDILDQTVHFPPRVITPSQAASALDKSSDTMSQSVTPSEPEASVEPNELLRAFLHGAGLDTLQLNSGLTPELMETLGKLLATSVQGTMSLIAQRALVKREVKADVTMVVVRKNNPLKFFPDSETVLTQMLRKKMPGFMGPTEAMEDAFLDLRAHQFGVVAGIKASTHTKDSFLKKLQPSNFEQGLSVPGFFDSFNPARRKAEMWDNFSATFNSLPLPARDEFQAVFGKDFLTAYEQEVERVKDEESRT